MRGRKPKPTAIKKLAGNPGKRKLPDDELAFSDSVPSPPDWMDGEALDEWNRVVPELQANGVLSAVNRATLVCYCQAWADFVVLTKEIKKTGMTCVGEKGGEYLSPLVSARAAAINTLMKIASEYGLTASSKSRIRAIDPQSTERKSLKSFAGKRA